MCFRRDAQREFRDPWCGKTVMKRQYRAPVDLDTIELWFNGSAGRGVHLHGEIAPSGEIRDRLVERAGHSLPTAHLSGEAAGKAVRQDVAVVA